METNDKKPTPEEILGKYEGQLRHYSNDIHYVRKSDAIKAMQEYAELYHKEKLRDELISFAGHRNGQHFLDWESEYLISVDEINDYLKTKE